MPNEGKHTVMSQSAYARHRGKSRQYISQLAQPGVLVMRGGKVDVEASDTVLDDRPVADVDPPSRPMRIAEDLSQGQPDSPGRGTFSQARTIEMVYRAKLCRLDFEAEGGEAHRCRGGAEQDFCPKSGLFAMGYSESQTAYR